MPRDTIARRGVLGQAPVQRRAGRPPARGAGALVKFVCVEDGSHSVEPTPTTYDEALRVAQVVLRVDAARATLQTRDLAATRGAVCDLHERNWEASRRYLLEVQVIGPKLPTVSAVASAGREQDGSSANGVEGTASTPTRTPPHPLGPRAGLTPRPARLVPMPAPFSPPQRTTELPSPPITPQEASGNRLNDVPYGLSRPVAGPSSQSSTLAPRTPEGRIVLNLVYTFDNVERAPIGYRVHQTQTLARMFNHFAQYLRRPVTHFTFKLDGTELQPDRAPIQLGLRDGDTIMVHESSGMMRFLD
ncbi:uncharacterized protein SCHCODRAFT_02618059 [Schizophyllum commune H4-8]|uniref:uncharacterized protein n=1 Tax=Schizophyllum commune (strain H4-8 / FGSC 9210) TaxID=578458 RepID=UPI00215F090E|nr:uncharacterized protein SCHCODRAFT_02618059 [Schizophyllum commune H4-8]KAI5894898.1 hypothetical protein SCHCODRAFT_02618059 [Schizophyllum commune H4-8]